eukprot:6497506-Prymnesium_polylepis.1
MPRRNCTPLAKNCDRFAPVIAITPLAKLRTLHPETPLCTRDDAGAVVLAALALGALAVAIMQHPQSPNS